MLDPGTYGQITLENNKGISIKGASSPIKDHIKETGHAASFDDFCILDKVKNNFDLQIHESLLILRDRPTLNQQNSSIPLYLFNLPGLSHLAYFQ